MDPELRAILVCPMCKEELLLVRSKKALLCRTCHHSYLINAEGVPIMTVVDD